MTKIFSSAEEIVAIFKAEVSQLSEKFIINDLILESARTAKESSLTRPGVYIFWKADVGVIKVGKSETNARKRALEHLRDDTKNHKLSMSSLSTDPSCHLLLITVAEDKDRHWVSSLESFLERKLNPLIGSKRTG